MQDAIEGLICTRNADSLQVRWLNPMAPFPNVSLRLFANDSSGVPAIRTVSVILCQCNSGNCTIDNTTLETATFDLNGYYQWPCQCPSFFSGDSCETDERGCGQFSLCTGSVCINDSSQASGYTCGDCLPGYRRSYYGEKCIGNLILIFSNTISARYHVHSHSNICVYQYIHTVTSVSTSTYTQ